MQTPSRKYLSARAPDVALGNVLTPDLQNARTGIVPGKGQWAARAAGERERRVAL